MEIVQKSGSGRGGRFLLQETGLWAGLGFNLNGTHYRRLVPDDKVWARLT